MKEILKSLILRKFPGLIYLVRACRLRRHCYKKYSYFQSIVADKLYGSDQIKILSGPFKGLKYFNEVAWGSITPRWIGSYEDELHELFYNIILKKNYDVILDIGAAEGYYAVGLAWLLYRSKVHSFDVDPFARKLQIKLAKLNRVSNLFIQQ